MAKAMSRRGLLAWSAASAATVAWPARAQAAWPEQVVRIVVPFPAGGVLDVMARMLARRLQAALAQSVIVDNRAGAEGQIGSGYVAHSKADGYTFLISGISLVTAPLLQPRLGYLPARDFTPVAMLGSTAGTLFANAVPGVPFQTVQEMIAYGKANPGKLSYATAGVGSLGHLLGSWISLKTGANLLHVPYKGGGPAQIDVISGRVPLWIDIASNKELVVSGKVKCLAVTSAQRTPILADVPTLQESGINIDGFTWWALMAPAGTPKAIVDRMSGAVGAIIDSPEGRQDYERLYIVPSYRNADDFTAFFRAEQAKWSRVIREAHIDS